MELYLASYINETFISIDEVKDKILTNTLNDNGITLGFGTLSLIVLILKLLMMEVCILAAKLNLSSIIAYPNPSSGDWNVQFTNLTDRQLFLYDYMGKLVWHSTVTDLQTIIPGQQLTTGVYLLKIQSKSEENTIKLIKQ